jgi:hypothetical protein
MDTTAIKHTVDDLSDRVRPKIEEARQEIGRVSGRITNFIQSRPTTCLVGAAALGYLVARIARSQH